MPLPIRDQPLKSPSWIGLKPQDLLITWPMWGHVEIWKIFISTFTKSSSLNLDRCWLRERASECVKVPTPAHQVLPLTGTFFRRFIATSHSRVIGQSELGNLWAGIGTLTHSLVLKHVSRHLLLTKSKSISFLQNYERITV